MPLWTELIFWFAVAWALVFMFRATRSRVLVGVLIGWSMLHFFLAKSGFYLVTDRFPPRPALLAGPLVASLVVMLILPTGRQFLRRCDLSALVLLHVLRVPVEIVLHEAWIHDLVPRSMTFSGTNFDILSGLSAPFLYWYIKRTAKPSKALLVAWNIICLALLANVVITAVLSVPSPIQQFNFDQPNRLVLQAPFVLLVAILVPCVLFAHVAALVRLTTDRSMPPA